MDNPFSKDAAPIDMGVVVDLVIEIVKTPAIKTGGTGRYHIHFNNEKTIVLGAGQLLQGPGRFCTLFFDKFEVPLKVEKEEWPEFVKWVATQATPGKPEETAAVMAGHLLFEEIATLKVTSDKSHIEKRVGCNRLVEHTHLRELWYVLPSAAVADMISELPMKVSPESVSQAMAADNLKKKNTHSIKVNGKPVRCWWFNVEKLKESNPTIELSKDGGCE